MSSASKYFPGEFEALEAELCGAFPISFDRLPPVKRERLKAWLAFPIEQRRSAYEAVKDTASYPIAMALDRLRNPAKYAPKPARKPAAVAQARTFDAIAAFLDDDEAPAASRDDGGLDAR